VSDKWPQLLLSKGSTSLKYWAQSLESTASTNLLRRSGKVGVKIHQSLQFRGVPLSRAGVGAQVSFQTSQQTKDADHFPTPSLAGAYGVVAAAKNRETGAKVAIKKITPMCASAVDGKLRGKGLC
jgi:hypothetical protein